MKLVVLMPEDGGQRFACHGCTRCCRDLVVHLTYTDRKKIDRQNWAGKFSDPPYVRLGREFVLNHAPGGGCIFLQQDGRCRIHAEFGPTQKPLACQLYPVTLEGRESGVGVGWRFDCPSVARNEGQPVVSHRPEITRLVGELATAAPELVRSDSRPLMLTASRALTAANTERLVQVLDDWLSDAGVSLARRLAGMCEFVTTLGEARLDRLGEDQLGELIDLLIGDLLNAVEDELPAATTRQCILLRQAAFAHAEHITPAQARASFLRSIAFRVDQLARARRLARGAGPMPKMAFTPSDARVVDIDAVELVAACDSAEAAPMSDLMTRYLRSRITTAAVFGPAYYGFSVADGLAALMLATSVIGWWSRYFAAIRGRNAVTMDDVVQAVGIVDRTSGRARELGARSAKLRLAYLSRDAGLLRLLRAYPIISP